MTKKFNKNHLRIKINPVPAPICNNILNADNAESKYKAIIEEININKIVEIFPTFTIWFSVASLFMNLL